MHFRQHVNEGGNSPQPALPGYTTGCYIHYYRTRILDLAMVSTGTLGNTSFLHIVGNLVNFIVSC